MNRWTWKNIVMFAVAIPFVYYFAGTVGKTAGERESAANTSPASPQEDNSLTVVSSVQDAEGLTNERMDIAFLKNLEEYTVQRMVTKTSEALSSRGLKDVDVKYSSQATYTEAGPIKLAVIRMQGSEGASAVFLYGVVGIELRRVGCVDPAGIAIPISYGKCAKKVEQVFGHKIGA